jgi:predicted Zn-dependent protease
MAILMRPRLIFLLLVLHLAACTVNPVTGERNFQVYGADWELQVGAEMYAPMKQSQGGEYILDPELTSYVQEVGDRLAARARRKDLLDFEFSVLNDSTPNAWALPGGKIVVNRGLLVNLNSEAELAAVLGHEIVHADAAHAARQQSKGILTQIGAVASMVILQSTIDSQSAREVAMMVPAAGAQLLSQKYGRDAEREADEYGMLYMSEAGYDPQGSVDLQKTFVKLAERRNQDWLSGLFASHPPSLERVENNEETASSLPPGGEIGQQRYTNKTAYLKRVQAAYKAFDEANKAASEGNLELAQSKLDLAMSIEPRESLFHSLQGDIHALGDELNSALASYSRAVRANDNFFYGYLRKGQVEYRLDRIQAARSDLSKSLELMPTAEAHYTLGLMDRDASNSSGAIEHFKVAARSDSATAQKSRRELVLLDLKQNPSNYVASQVVMDTSNNVWAQVVNLTSVPLVNIDISFAWLDEQGQTRNGKKTWRGPLAGGKQAQLQLGVKLANPDELNRRFRIEVTAASVAE